MDQFRNLMVSLVVPHNDLLDMTDNDLAETKRQAEAAGLEKLQQSLNILIAREEELRTTSHSRLVLETIMIKLSRLGDIFSFEELMRKIEGLERRISIPSSGYDIGSAGHVSETASAWAKEEGGGERGIRKKAL